MNVFSSGFRVPTKFRYNNHLNEISSTIKYFSLSTCRTNNSGLIKLCLGKISAARAKQLLNGFTNESLTQQNFDMLIEFQSWPGLAKGSVQQALCILHHLGFDMTAKCCSTQYCLGWLLVLPKEENLPRSVGGGVTELQTCAAHDACNSCMP